MIITLLIILALCAGIGWLVQGQRGALIGLAVGVVVALLVAVGTNVRLDA